MYIYIGLDWWLSMCDWDVEMFFSNLFLENDSRFFKYYLKLGVIYIIICLIKQYYFYLVSLEIIYLLLFIYQVDF